MSSELKKESLCRSKEKERLKLEKNLEQELVLPDYCADIKRILKCTVTPGIHSVSCSGQRVTVRGEVLIRLVYADDKEKIDCYEKTVELSSGGQFAEDHESPAIIVSASADYVNCRAVNPRRVNVSSGISVICSVRGVESKEILSSAGEGIEVRKQKCSEESVLCQSEKTFDMSETVVLDKDKPGVSKIIRQDAYAVIESQKAVEGKLLIKGELVVRVVYCSSENGNKPIKLIHKMPLSQIADVEGLTRECKIRTLCKVNQLNVTQRSDSSGEGRLLDVAARISCFVCGSTVKEYEYIADCYSVSSAEECTYTRKDVFSCAYEGKKELSLTASVQALPFKEICDIWVSEKNVRLIPQGERVKAELRLTLCMLGFNENGCPEYKETEAEFESCIELKKSCSEIMCDFDFDVIDVSCAGINQGTAEITALINADIRIFSVESISLVSEIKPSAEEVKAERPALTLYYCSKGEKIWDIAKKYRTTVEALCCENNIDGDSVSEAKMLMIPCV